MAIYDLHKATFFQNTDASFTQDLKALGAFLWRHVPSFRHRISSDQSTTASTKVPTVYFSKSKSIEKNASESSYQQLALRLGSAGAFGFAVGGMPGAAMAVGGSLMTSYLESSDTSLIQQVIQRTTLIGGLGASLLMVLERDQEIIIEKYNNGKYFDCLAYIISQIGLNGVLASVVYINAMPIIHAFVQDSNKRSVLKGTVDALTPMIVDGLKNLGPEFLEIGVNGQQVLHSMNIPTDCEISSELITCVSSNERLTVNPFTVSLVDLHRQGVFNALMPIPLDHTESKGLHFFNQLDGFFNHTLYLSSWIKEGRPNEGGIQQGVELFTLEIGMGDRIYRRYHTAPLFHSLVNGFDLMVIGSNPITLLNIISEPVLTKQLTSFARDTYRAPFHIDFEPCYFIASLADNYQFQWSNNELQLLNLTVAPTASSVSKFLSSSVKGSENLVMSSDISLIMNSEIPSAMSSEMLATSILSSMNFSDTSSQLVFSASVTPSHEVVTSATGTGKTIYIVTALGVPSVFFLVSGGLIFGIVFCRKNRSNQTDAERQLPSVLDLIEETETSVN